MLYHGGAFNESGTRIWLTPDFDYAAALAQLYDCETLWQVTVAANEDEILDLTGCGPDVAAVVAALVEAGSSQPAEDDANHPHRVLWRLSDDVIHAAGYRAVRLREWIDWGAGPRYAESLCLIDMSAIVRSDVVVLSPLNYQLESDPPARARRSRTSDGEEVR
jgi:hypothetical protein